MTPSPQLRPLADAAELIRLRWVAVAVQVVAVVVAAAAGYFTVAPVLAVLVAIGIASNIALERRRDHVPESGTAALIALDALLLTAMLLITGGPSSPYTPLYLVYPVLAALLLRPTLAWASLVVVLTSYGSLVLLKPPDSVMGHAYASGQDMTGHAVGMFASVAVAAPFLVATLLRARQTLTDADARVARARLAEESNRRLTSLATLAAGASHELATPLGTIAVAAGELSRKADPGSALAGDAELIRDEVARCRRVLHELTADVGTSTGELGQSVPVGDVLDLILVGYGDEIRVEMSEELEEHTWVMPPRLVSQAVRRLLGNARGATPKEDTVILRIEHTSGSLRFQVVDKGPGMSPEVLARALEPFFTTKPTGVGMGLGLWFVQSVAEHLGGRLQLDSTPGVGTVATLTLPESARNMET